MPSETTMEGTIRLATATVNSAPSPRKRLRKARPAKNAMPTVSPITTRPRRSERQSAPQMSTMPRPAQSLPNQCVETPFIGKVRPPCGPWKLSTRMVSVGPYRKATKRAKNAASA